MSKLTIEKYGKFWAVYDEGKILICVTVYKKGAKEVVNRLCKAWGNEEREGRQING